MKKTNGSSRMNPHNRNITGNRANRPAGLGLGLGAEQAGPAGSVEGVGWGGATGPCWSAIEASCPRVRGQRTRSSVRSRAVLFVSEEGTPQQGTAALELATGSRGRRAAAGTWRGRRQGGRRPSGTDSRRWGANPARQGPGGGEFAGVGDEARESRGPARRRSERGLARGGA